MVIYLIPKYLGDHIFGHQQNCFHNVDWRNSCSISKIGEYKNELLNLVAESIRQNNPSSAMLAYNATVLESRIKVLKNMNVDQLNLL